MKLGLRPLPLSPRLPVLLLCVWVLCAPLPVGAAGPSAGSATAVRPASEPTPAPTPTPVLSPRAPTGSGATDASAPESRKAHPISAIFVIGPTPEPTPTPEPGPPPEGLRPPVLLPPSPGSGPGGAITLGDLATSLSLAPRPTPPPLPALTPPAIPAPAVVATPAPVATPEAPCMVSPLQSYASSFSTGSQPVLVIPSNLLTPARRLVSRSR